MAELTTLPNGLRVTTAAMPHMESVSVGLWIGVGSRYEPRSVAGVSHFIEHLLFKGTRRRNARQISESVEGVGGYLNAFTGEETTCYYAKASHRHLDLLLDVLADMYLHPLFPRGEIVKERQVIREELLMYRDQPQQHVHEMLGDTLWPHHPLGRPVAGTPESVGRLDRGRALAFKQRHYHAGATVLAVAGHCEHAAIVARARRALPLAGGHRLSPFRRARTQQRGPRLQFLRKEVEQTQLALGLRGCSRHDHRRYALKLLSVLLGENMSSRLFQVVREEHGLAYSIHSSTSFFADTGAMIISAGLDTAKLPRALKLILRELARLARQPVGAAELQRVKDYTVGQMRLGLESSTNQMMWLGEHLLAYGEIEPPEVIERQVLAVTAPEIRAVASQLFQAHRLNAAVITPAQNEGEIKRLLRFG